MGRMTGKIAVITGAAHGIGAAMAARFAEEGATIVLLDLDAANLERTAASLTGSNALSITADVTNEAAVSNAFSQITSAHNRIDALVTNVAAPARTAACRWSRLAAAGPHRSCARPRRATGWG